MHHQPIAPAGAVPFPIYERDGFVRAWALVDRDDFDWLSCELWYLVAGYAKKTGGGKNAWMHRVIMEPTESAQEVDHINRNRLDNRRCNLRIVSRIENMANQPPTGRGTSKYRGVGWYKPYGKWRAKVNIAGRPYHLGYFDDEEEAARVAREFRLTAMPGATD